jgi:glycosyltransferase involved in cell wall biosynthesis
MATQASGAGPRLRLLFISPVLPAPAGNGLAMRAGLFLEGLAADHDVFLLLVPVAAPADAVVSSQFVARRTRRVVTLPLEGRADSHFGLILRLTDPVARAAALTAYPRPALCRFATPQTVRDAAALFADTSFDVVHVMRLYLAPFAAPYLEAAAQTGRPACVLDLDDDEPTTRRRLAALHAARRDPTAAAAQTVEADKYERLEEATLLRFHRALVCSEIDAAAVIGRVPGARVSVIPNAVRVPADTGPRRLADVFTLLLVGSMGYGPNAAAAEELCREVLPRVRAAADREVRVMVVGSHPTPAVARLAEIPGVTVTGAVPEVTPYYGRADVAVIPVRAGGGTRIKLLEAFAHRVPAVATPMGAEGLDVLPGQHLLVGDGPDALAAACLRLLREPALGRQLADAAYTLVRRRYALPVVARAIRTFYRDLREAPAVVDGEAGHP